ncbi:response regulator transcription factor [Pontibacter sp. BT310]|uniref:Response regulator transcription factor n=1 Tax=Pontibacter populi TaxID=890055 RepID=A0ABS6XBN0_9BACT|nr:MULTISPECIES: response regulator transcription factor [Pontibacter]MBJ6118211.1 response regulator transcription factor [Pontibacter sp. BT310]MBR0570638.1 response regulator transcription factor [Microvirga sp. STS03]MBW3365064.1 response regulator transcription factor [Pontibacter populi]
MIRILIADDFVLIREGLKKVIKREPDMRVVAEAINGGEVIRLLQKNEVDIVVLDISMPVRDGIDVLKDINKYYPTIPVLILTMHSEKKYAVRALMAGAAGYLTKEGAARELILAIRKIYEGGKYISPALAEYLVEAVRSGSNQDKKHELLSDKEFQILCKLAAGTSVKNVAEELNITTSTVHTYKNRIYKKMEISTIPELTKYCITHHLLE